MTIEICIAVVINYNIKLKKNISHKIFVLKLKNYTDKIIRINDREKSSVLKSE
jgi:hypothetical protein